MDMNIRPAPTLHTSPPFEGDDPRWARIVARDKSADGRFWYSVSTTGIYCRPSCPSRTANPKNVALHDTLESARATGFRPCRRCNPDGPSLECENAALIAKACRIIEESEEEPSLEELAATVDRSPSYFHRMFKTSTGLTPKAYATGHRAKKVRAGLETGTSVTEAMYDAGFNSSGRFYEKSTGMLGMTATQYRASGANEEIKFAVGQSYLGAILVASSTDLRLATIKAIAQGTLDGLIPTRNIAANDEALIDRMVGIKGIGRWTVEMLLMYADGYPARR